MAESIRELMGSEYYAVPVTCTVEEAVERILTKMPSRMQEAAA